MTSPDLETAIQKFKHKQKVTRLVLVVVITLVLATTIFTIEYLRYQSQKAEASARKAEASAIEQKEQLDRLAAEAHLRWDMRTERPLNEGEILLGVTGDLQKKVITEAIALYKQKPPIPYTWGGKSPQSGFDSSGYVAYILAEVGVLKNPGTYWSGRLREALKPVPIEQKRPGDVVFYPGGVCMFYLGGPDDLSIGALPGGIATGRLDQVAKPEAVRRY